jgi:hypothetical protein
MIGSIRRECLDHQSCATRRTCGEFQMHASPATTTHELTSVFIKRPHISDPLSASAESFLDMFSVAFTVNVIGCSFQKGQHQRSSTEF